MKLTKNSLRKMILKEIRISIARSNLALEEDEELEEELGSGMTSYLDTEASNTTYTTSHGYKGDNMSTIAEGGGEHPDAEIFDEAIRLVEVLRDEIVAENKNTALQLVDELWDFLRKKSRGEWGNR